VGGAKRPARLADHTARWNEIELAGALQPPLIPAQAGIHGQNEESSNVALGPRFRGDEREKSDLIASASALDQLQPLQTRVPLLSHDDVVVHRDAERLCHLDDRLR